MDARVKKIIEDYRKALGHEEAHAKILKVMESTGFEHAVEYFVQHGYDDPDAIDTRIVSVSTEFMADRIKEGVKPGNDLTRESLAFTYAQLEGFPDDAKEAMIEIGMASLMD